MPLILSARNVQVIFTLKGQRARRFQDFSEAEDAIMMPEDVQLVNSVTGATGKKFFSGTAEQGGEVTLKFLPVSDDVKWLFNHAMQVMDNDILNSWSGSIVAPDHGFDHVLTNGALSKTPLGLTFGKGATNRPQWTWDFERIAPNYANAQFQV